MSGKIANEKELLSMLEYLDDVSDRDKIDLARFCVASKMDIIDDDFALWAFDEVIKPFLEKDIKRELIQIRTN
jgi:hypothetical protein